MSARGEGSAVGEVVVRAGAVSSRIVKVERARGESPASSLRVALAVVRSCDSYHQMSGGEPAGRTSLACSQKVSVS